MLQTITDVEILRTGKFTSSEGVEVGFTVSDLKKIAQEYNNRIAKTNVLRPVTDGHPTPGSNVPAYGWVKELIVKGASLFATIDASEKLIEWFRNKEKRYRSIGLRGGLFDHLAVLGSDAPAVDNLADVTFSAEKYETIQFSELQSSGEDLMTDETNNTPEAVEQAQGVDVSILQFQQQIEAIKSEKEALAKELLELRFSANVAVISNELQATAVPAARVPELAKAIAELSGNSTNFSTEGSPLKVVLDVIKSIQPADNAILTNSFAAPSATSIDEEKYLEEVLLRNAKNIQQ